uniref:Uncharacterized protein n=1 Tax=Rhizophora mucronata TaxID=61149 RepID=A0A2P2MZW0_RHIMU
MVHVNESIDNPFNYIESSVPVQLFCLFHIA